MSTCRFFLFFVIALFVLSCTDKDVSDQFFPSDANAISVDTPRVSIAISTLSDKDRELIFKFATELEVEVTGFASTTKKSFFLTIGSLGKSHISQSFEVFRNKEYTIAGAKLLDKNKSIIAVCPIKQSLWGKSVTNPIPYSFTSSNSGNTMVILTFIPSVGANLVLTGYDLSENVTSLPYLNFELQIRDDANFGNFISSRVDIRRESNNLLIYQGEWSNTGRFPLQLYYYDSEDAFIFEAEGYTLQGYKTKVERKTADFLYNSYDRTTRNLPYSIRL